ncbi:MAG: HAMP domain-containing histidine kinase [Sandaracinaceae bacterium]|nr:HAMP domain-containing histidine kinase [Sandaracinaceae bacterium]
MSIHATLLVGWSGTLGFLAVWFALLARLRPEERLFRVFAGACLSTGLTMLATAALLAAPNAALAAQWRSFQLAGLGITAVMLPDLVSGLLQRPVPRALPQWVGVIFGVLAASGVLVDPLASRASGQLTTAGATGTALLALAVAPATFALARSALTTRGLGIIAVALVVALVGGLADMARLVSSHSSWELAPHSLGIAALAFGATLMRRAVSAEAELERSSALLVRALEDVREEERGLLETRSRAALGELAAVIAHEVRNPLAVLRNAASSLRKPTTSSVDVETLVEIIQEETRRLDELGRSLARYAEPLPFRPERIAVDALLRDVVVAVSRAHEAPPDVTLEVVPTDEHVNGDPALLRQAFVNVVDNAIRASARAIVLSVVRCSEGVRIDVTDDGEGMSDAVLERARDPFFTTRATGTGLGLALVDKVVRLHRGALALARRTPRGTVVSITLDAAS